jgi:hypothetical protein
MVFIDTSSIEIIIKYLQLKDLNFYIIPILNELVVCTLLSVGLGSQPICLIF